MIYWNIEHYLLTHPQHCPMCQVLYGRSPCHTPLDSHGQVVLLLAEVFDITTQRFGIQQAWFIPAILTLALVIPAAVQTMYYPEHTFTLWVPWQHRSGNWCEMVQRLRHNVIDYYISRESNKGFAERLSPQVIQRDDQRCDPIYRGIQGQGLPSRLVLSSMRSACGLPGGLMPGTSPRMTTLG